MRPVTNHFRPISTASSTNRVLCKPKATLLSRDPVQDWKIFVPSVCLDLLSSIGVDILHRDILGLWVSAYSLSVFAYDIRTHVHDTCACGWMDPVDLLKDSIFCFLLDRFVIVASPNVVLKVVDVDPVMTSRSEYVAEPSKPEASRLSNRTC